MTEQRERTPDPVDAAAIAAAHRLLTGHVRRTPLLELNLPQPASTVWAKAENLQRTGSFKVRGALQALLAQRQRTSAAPSTAGCITYSAGNHGRALAHAARLTGVSATVVMPATATPAKIEATRRAGAEVLVVEPDAIVARAHELESERGLAFVHPFDDPQVIAGQGTVGLELLDQLDELPGTARPGNARQLDVVLVPVGGGGLLAGVALAVRSLRPDVRVIGVEPALAGDLAQGFRAGERVEWDRGRTRRTIADGLRSPQVGAIPWSIIARLVDDVLVVEERSILHAMRILAEQTNTIVEPSGAVATAAALEHAERFADLSVATIVSGGNVDPTAYAQLLEGPKPTPAAG